MDRIKLFKKVLRAELAYEASAKSSMIRDLEYHLIINPEETEFVLLQTGWSGKRFLHGVIFHYQIKNGKIYLLENKTDIDVGERLIDKGVLKSEIVIAFVNELERTAEGYAAA